MVMRAVNEMCRGLGAALARAVVGEYGRAGPSRRVVSLVWHCGPVWRVCGKALEFHCKTPG